MISTLAILGTTIRQDAEGRFCLNDCHKAATAAGHDYKSTQVEHFTRNASTEGLIQELLKNGELEFEPVSSKAGRYGGTYAVKELVYAYAMWISPAFHLQVIRAFDAMVTAAPLAFSVPKSLSEALRLAADQAELIEEMKPKVAAHAIITEAAGDLGVRDAGREVKLGQGWVANTMLARKWACRQGGALRPAHYGLEMGYVRLCATPYTCRVTGETKVRDDIKVTRKGIDRLAQIIAHSKSKNTKEMEAV